MKLALFLGVLLAGYAYFLMHTTDIVMSQTTQLFTAYQSIADNADQIATGR